MKDTDTTHRCGNGSYIDLARSKPLGDVGGSGYLACTVLIPDGDELLALLLDDHTIRTGTEPFKPADWTDVAPHELTGPVPRSWARRHGLLDLRCGAPNAQGKPCKVKVRNPGDRCCFHLGNDKGAGL